MRNVNFRYINLIGISTTQKKEFSICSNQLIFKDKNGKEITLNEDDIQYYLCCAIERVHEIIMKNIKNYQLEQPVNFGLDTQNSDLKELLKV
jgi:hypothetical protein